MPWWSWLVIWGVLVVALLALLAWQAIRLFGKFMGAMRALGELAEKASVLERQADAIGERRFQAAAFQSAARLSYERRQDAARRADRRQAHREARVQRGRLITKADPRQYSHLSKRT
jgi:hypothetical protein